MSAVEPAQPRVLRARPVRRCALGPRPSAQGRGGQGGFSLVEVLIALALASVVVLGLASGLFTLIRVSSDTMVRQQIQVALGNFGESLKAAPYRECHDPADNATADTYQDAYDSWGVRWTPPANMSARIVKVEYWDRTSREFTSSCNGDDHGAQRLTMRVEWAERDGQAQIVKRS